MSAVSIMEVVNTTVLIQAEVLHVRVSMGIVWKGACSVMVSIHLLLYSVSLKLCLYTDSNNTRASITRTSKFFIVTITDPCQPVSLQGIADHEVQLVIVVPVAVVVCIGETLYCVTCHAGIYTRMGWGREG